MTIVTDPYAPKLGRTLPRGLSADVLLLSHDHWDHNYKEGVGGNPFVIDRPGEYETRGVFVYGVSSWHDATEGAERGPNLLFRGEVEGVSFVHCGDLGHELTEAQLAIVEDAHILFIPVGGTYTIDAAVASKVISQVEPRIVIPMHYALPGLAVTLDSVEKFCREMGVSAKETLPSLRVTAGDLPQEEVRIVLLDLQV